MWVRRDKYLALKAENCELRLRLIVRKEQVSDLRKAVHRMRSIVGGAVREAVAEAHVGYDEKYRQIKDGER